jgi:hypothetical protein
MPPDDDEKNPYERWDIDPAGGPAAITERMRELIELEDDPDQKTAIRKAWEELTLHPARRFRAAIGAHPDHRGALGRRPAPPRPSIPPSVELTLSDVVMRPSILAALGARAPELPELPLDNDPVMAR